MAESKEDSITDAQFATNSPVIPLQNPLWDYACGVYSQDGVEAELLILQDEHGADINLILQALWLASEGIEWTPQCIPDDYEKWVAEQVIPIRTMRRRLKTQWVEQRSLGFEDFRQQVKKLELQAEQYALAMLYVSCEKYQSGKAISKMENLEKLGKSMNISSEHFPSEHFPSEYFPSEHFKALVESL